MKKPLINIWKIKQIRQIVKWEEIGNKILQVGNDIRDKLETKNIANIKNTKPETKKITNTKKKNLVNVTRRKTKALT